MPTYEYACTACQHEWEFEQSIKEDALKECPSCKEQTARRQISRGTGFILKGSGWYSDLYSSSSNKKPDATETKSDAKPADAKGDSASSTPAAAPAAAPSTTPSAPSSSSAAA
jgi:putative FmdB family regulatory protein